MTFALLFFVGTTVELSAAEYDNSPNYEISNITATKSSQVRAGNAQIYVHDDLGNPMNVYLELHNVQSGKVYTGETGNDGYIDFNVTETGNYFVRMTPAQGYQPDQDDILGADWYSGYIWIDKDCGMAIDITLTKIDNGGGDGCDNGGCDNICDDNCGCDHNCDNDCDHGHHKPDCGHDHGHGHHKPGHGNGGHYGGHGNGGHGNGGHGHGHH